MYLLGGGGGGSKMEHEPMKANPIKKFKNATLKYPSQKRMYVIS